MYKQAGGLWCGSVELGRDATGRRQRRVVKARTKTEALRKLAEASKLRDEGLPQPDARITVSAFLDRWLETVAANRAHATWRGVAMSSACASIFGRRWEASAWPCSAPRMSRSSWTTCGRPVMDLGASNMSTQLCGRRSAWPSVGAS